MSEKIEKRDVAIDILRTIGILLIILAHTSLSNDSSSIAFNIRNFDVVLMVYISGLSFCLTYKPIKTKKDFFIKNEQINNFCLQMYYKNINIQKKHVKMNFLMN